MSIEDLAGFGKAAERLVEVVARGLGTAYGDLFAVWRARVHAEARKIEAAAEVDATRMAEISAIELARIQEETRAILPSNASRERFEAISPLQEKIVEAALEQGIRQVDNMLAVTSKAVKHLAEAEEAEVEADGEVEEVQSEVDPDWTSRFFETAKRVSGPELQDLWARVLAREVGLPGTVAPKTLAVLDTLTKQDAELFEWALGYEHGGAVLDGFVHMAANGFSRLRHLQYMGLLSASAAMENRATDGVARFEVGGHTVVATPYKYSSPDTVRLGGYPLTRAGRDLASVLGVTQASDFRDALTRSVHGEGHEIVEAPLD